MAPDEPRNRLSGHIGITSPRAWVEYHPIRLPNGSGPADSAPASLAQTVARWPPACAFDYNKLTP